MITAHTCAADDCDLAIGNEHTFCRFHHRRLPRDLQLDIYHGWRNVSRDIAGYKDAKQRAVQWHRDHPATNLHQGDLL